MRTRPAGVDYPLGDSLVVEVGDFLAGVKVLQQSGSALADRERIVGVVNANPLLGGQVSGVPPHPGRRTSLGRSRCADGRVVA